jgi:hypothetical protein
MINRHSISLEPVENKPNLTALTFTYDCEVPCAIQVILGGHEIIAENQSTVGFETDTAEFPSPVTFNTTPGKNLEIQSDLVVFDPTMFGSGGAWTPDSRTCPLILDIAPATNPDNSHSTIFLDIVEYEPSAYTVKLVQQKYHLAGRSYYEMEVYGLANPSQEEPCIICMTELKDTIVLPCRHL